MIKSYGLFDVKIIFKLKKGILKRGNIMRDNEIKI